MSENILSLASIHISSEGELQLKQKVSLPDILDVLIVGGGPGGTATAFRAKELGLAMLVIDFDDIMKRIRDYTKDKLILPNFGGGDKMQFPDGGDLVSLLHFAPIDNEEMCLQWKAWYVQHCIPAHLGVELTALQREDDLWRAVVWNHNTQQEQSYLARHVVIAVGRGVPRRFDIPGNTDGIAYHLTDARNYVGAPVCVIGGGTSAAEAVIAISNAKADAQDASPVHWSYRGDKMPKVSKALSDVFFKAFVSNGNIRYHPRSEPVTVLTAEDHKEYLSIRTERKFIKGSPNETNHLEFLKERCIACIGEDIPEAFLSSLGISMVVGGPKNRKRMVTARFLETQQPNVFLVGDILSQAYFVADDFDADPSVFPEVKHRGNIKSALRDGVCVAEVIRSRLDGKDPPEFLLPEPKPEMMRQQPDKTIVDMTTIIEQEGPPEESTRDSGYESTGTAVLIRIIAGNVEETEYSVKSHGVTTIGHKDSDITIPDDSFLSDRHASISHSEDGYLLRDDGGKTGVFFRAPLGRYLEVRPGDVVSAGNQFLLFQVDGNRYGFLHYNREGKEMGRWHLHTKFVVLGRDATGIILDRKDMTLSRRHLALAARDNKILLKDLKSVNGTYLRIRHSVSLSHGDEFRVGQQIFTFSLNDEAVVDRGHTTSSMPIEHPKAKKSKPLLIEDTADSAQLIRFLPSGQTCPVQAGKTICDLAEEHDIELNAECHAGSCGSDPLRILEGQENLSKMTDEERETLEDICELDPAEHRLACMARINGAVEVEIVTQ